MLTTTPRSTVTLGGDTYAVYDQEAGKFCDGCAFELDRHNERCNGTSAGRSACCEEGPFARNVVFVKVDAFGVTPIEMLAKRINHSVQDAVTHTVLVPEQCMELEMAGKLYHVTIQEI